MDERTIEEQRAQDDAFQAYLDQMGRLLLEKDLVNSDEGDVERRLARARTLTVLERLDQDRKTLVMRFLVEARLVQGAVKTDLNENTEPRDPIEDFIVDLREGYLGGRRIEDMLEGPIIDLALVDLSGAEVRGGYLSVAHLRAADLTGADLTGADLRLADLGSADLRGAHLPNADLSAADLSDADLSGADLADVKGITDCDLDQQAKSLEGATMTNGQKYEDWLEDRECQEENNGTS